MKSASSDAGDEAARFGEDLAAKAIAARSRIIPGREPFAQERDLAPAGVERFLGGQDQLPRT